MRTARKGLRGGALAVLAGGLAAWGPALAEDAEPLTAAQAASLDRAVRLWTSTPAGDRADAPADYTVTPEGDHYRIVKRAARMAPSSKLTMTGGDLTAAVRPVDGGAWQFDDIAIATPLVVTGDAGDESLRVSLELQGQAGHARVDPSLATATVSDTSGTGLGARFTVGTDADVAVRGGPYTNHQALQPAGPGRVDGTLRAELRDVVAETKGKAAKAAVRVAVKSATVEGRVAGLSPDTLSRVLATMRDKLQAEPSPAPAPGAPDPAKRAGTQQDTPPAAPPPAADNAPGAPTPGDQPPPAQAADVAPAADAPSLTPAQRVVLRGLMKDLREVASSGQLEYGLHDVTVSAAGHDVRLKGVTLGQGATAVDGKADLHMRLVVEGLGAADIPPALRDYVPRRVVLAPRVTGLDLDELFRLIDRALEEDKPRPAEMEAMGAGLLGHGPVEVRLDEAAFDVGPATLHAVGAMRVTGAEPSAVAGSADVDARGLGALIKKASTDPLLKQAAPVLIFLKGIGEEQPDGALRWKVAYADGGVTVNGTDLSKLIR